MVGLLEHFTHCLSAVAIHTHQCDRSLVIRMIRTEVTESKAAYTAYVYVCSIPYCLYRVYRYCLAYMQYSGLLILP